MKKYLVSGMIKGIGPTFAGRLADAFQAQVFEVIEQAPHRFLEVDGIGQDRQGKIVTAWHGTSGASASRPPTRSP